MKSLPASQRPKTAAYPSLDDPFSSPIADAMQSQFEKMGVKTVYKTIYPAETTDMTPIVAKAIAKKPDMIVAGTQSEDAYGQVKALVQAKYNPKFLFFANGANSPTEFPSKVGAKNVNGIFSCSDWTPDRADERERALRPAVPEEVRRHASSTSTTTRPRPGRSVSCSSSSPRRRARSTTRRSSRRSTRARGRRSRATSPGTPNGSPNGERPARRVGQRQAAARVPGEGRARASRSHPKPAWGG